MSSEGNTDTTGQPAGNTNPTVQPVGKSGCVSYDNYKYKQDGKPLPVELEGNVAQPGPSGNVNFPKPPAPYGSRK